MATSIFDRYKFFPYSSSYNSILLIITDKGVFAYNVTSDTLTETELDDCQESRIEVIATELDVMFEAQLMKCMNGE